MPFQQTVNSLLLSFSSLMPNFPIATRIDACLPAISQSFGTFTIGVVGLKCHKIILVCTYIPAQEHGMHRKVTRPTLFIYFIIKGSGTETTTKQYPKTVHIHSLCWHTDHESLCIICCSVGEVSSMYCPLLITYLTSLGTHPRDSYSMKHGVDDIMACEK